MDGSRTPIEPPVGGSRRIGIAGPVSLELLDYPTGAPEGLPVGYRAPVVAHFVNALLRRGYHVVVFTTSGGLDMPRVIDQDRLVVCIAPRYRARSALTFFHRERRWLGMLMSQHRCELIHAMWSYEFALAALDSGTPTLVHYRDHSGAVLRHSRDWYRLLRWLLDLRVSLRARYTVANSEYLRKALGRRGRGMQVIPNFLPRAGPGATEGHLQSEREYLLTVCNGFGRLKNVEPALGAFRMLRSEGLAGEYRLVGDEYGPGEAADTFARASGLGAGVRFLGRLSHEDAVAQIRGAAVLVHPSREESFGMVILEAMASRTPVVAGAASGNAPELLGGGSGGRLCDVGDAAALRDAVADVLRDRPATKRRCENAYARYREQYTEDRVMADLEKCYASMLSECGARAD